MAVAGPHVAPADAERMIERQRRLDELVNADPEVERLKAIYLEKWQANEQARRELEHASFLMDEAVTRVLASADLRHP